MSDSYVWRARTVPALIAAAPAAGLLVGGLLAPSHAARIGASVAAVALVIASHLARDAGRRLQPRLWDAWGGSPTLRRLRHRDAEQPERIERLHRRMQDVLGVRLPVAHEEAQDPARADAAYDDAVAGLRTRTRDRARFPLVFEENANYGFRRNMLGLRPWALAIALAVVAACVVGFVLTGGTTGERLRAWAWPAALAALAAVLWWRAVTPAWAKLPAEAYADRLLESLDTLRTSGAAAATAVAGDPDVPEAREAGP